jgi:hypothetical protein
MALLIWIVRILVILLLVRLAITFVRGTLLSQGRGRGGQRRPVAKPPERIGGKLVRDPSCGTYIPMESAIVHGRGDAREYFCSTACRDAWLARPATGASARSHS